MSSRFEQVKLAARGRWLEILPTLGGLTLEQLTNRQQPCPCCGGTDRYRFDDKGGDGDWYCNRCGGPDGSRGGGDGFDLLMGVQGWSRQQAIEQVAAFVGSPDSWSAEDAAEARQRARKAREQQQLEEDQRKAQAAARAQQEWDAAVPLVEVDHQTFERCYWSRKGLQPTPALRLDTQGRVLVPLRAADGTLRAVQQLPVAGKKITTRGARLEGLSAALGDLSAAEVVAIAEGAATAGSIHQVTGWPVVFATGKEGLKWAIAQAKGAAPQADLLICADNDADGGGQKVAQALALEHGARWAMPPANGLDFNDWHQLEGLAVVRDALNAALAAAPAVAAAAEPQTFEECWDALEAYALEVVQKGWPVCKAIAALSRRARELSIPSQTERRLEQLMAAAHRKLRAVAGPIAPGGTFTVSATPWAVDGVFRHGLNLLVGQSGAGKSRLAADLMAAWLRGDREWLGRPLQGPPVEQRHALILGSDQGAEDWALTLEPVGLCIRTSATEVQLHKRLTLYPLEAGQVLDADGLAIISRWIDQHPGGMVLVDSLSACLPPGVDEDKAGSAKPVHDLQEALGNGWGILTHHSRKSAGKENDLGVNAGRGSSAIAAAVSRVVNLGLIHKLEHGVRVAQENNPQRELLSTKRGGPPVNLIITSDAQGHWSQVGDAIELKRQEQQDRIRQGLTDIQADVLAVLEIRPGQWLTTRDVVEGLGVDWEEDKRKNQTAAANARKVLQRLRDLGLVESVRAGLENTYRAVDQEALPPYGEEFNKTSSNSSN